MRNNENQYIKFLHGILFFLITSCAGKAGRPEFKFRIIEFFPPSGFQISVTQFSISIAFSKIIDEKSITEQNIKIIKDGAEIRKVITIPENQKIKITPEIISKGTYKVVVSKNIKSITGETLPEDFSWEFYVVGEGEYIIPITPPTLPPLVKSIYPPHLGLVGRDTIIYAIFTKKITNISTLNFFVQDINGKIIDSSLTYIEDGNIAVLRPVSLLEPGGTYIVSLKSNIRAYDGETLGKDVVWLFKTFGLGEDKTPPQVILINPPNGATGVPTSSKILILFSENIDTSSVNITNVQIIEEGTGSISYTYEYNPALFQLTITPSLLQIGKTYTVKIRGIRDTAGNTMTEEFSSTFSTGAGTIPTPPPAGKGFPPQILEILIDEQKVNLPETPQGVSTTPTIKIKFSDKLDSSTVNSSTLFISDGVNIIPSTISFSLDLKSVALSPNSDLEQRKTYWCFITNGIKDQDGESLANPITFPFRILGIIITSPAQDQYLKGVINIQVDFSANLNRLELWIDSTKRQSALPPISSPFTFTEDTRLHPDGTRIIKVIAYLKSPATTISYSVRVTFDNAPPSLAIQFPDENAVVSGTTNIVLLANDSGKIKKVEFYVDGILNTTATSPTTAPNIYIFSLNTAALSNGNHTISFIAEDEAGNISGIISRTLTVDNSPPTGYFISPQSGSIVGGSNINVEANPSDNIGIKKIEFYFNSSKICDAISLACEKTSPPWKITWNSTSISYFSSGSLTGVVEDLGGLKTVFSTSITVDNTPPAVSINTPSAGMYLKGSTTIQVSFSDASPITYIAILINDILKFSASNPSSPYTAMWNTNSETDGTKIIKALVYDKAGNQGIHQISVVSDNTPPSGTITFPSNGTYTNALTINITASATDNILLDRVEFYRDGNFIGFDSTPPTYSLSHDISALTDGTYSLTAAVFDFAGNVFVTPSPITFIVDRTPPTVDFVDPLTGGVVFGTKLVKTTASDSGIIKTISIQAGSTNLGSCNINAVSGNCDRNWPTSGDANDVVLKATATDTAGNQSVTQITVMVDNLFPSVSITSPTLYYLTCPTNTVLGGTASDTNTITAVVFNVIDLSTNTNLAQIIFTYTGTTPVSEFSTLTPAQCGSDGTKRLQLTAYDKGGKSITASRDFFVDNTPPTLSVIYPPVSECVSGVTSIKVQICDNAFVKDLTTLVDSTLISSINVSSSISCASPQTKNINWSSSSFSDGSHTIEITLKDGAGNIQTQSIPILIDNSPPTITIISPADNSTLSSPTLVNVTLGDSVCPPPSYNFKKVEYQIAVSGTNSFSSSNQDCATTQKIPCTDTNVGSGNSTFTWSATEYCGFFKLKAKGYDYAGNISEKTITLKIQPPGCPIEESWSPQSVLGSIRTTPIIRDLEGDGKKEIIFGTDSGRIYGISQSTIVQNASSVGSAIRSILLETTVSGAVKAVFGMLDPAKRIRAINLTSPFLSDFSSVLTGTGIYSSPSTIFSDSNTAVFLIGDLAGRIGMYEINSSGIILRDCLPAGTPLDCGLNSAAISDINSDTQPDIKNTPLPVDTDCDGSYDTVIVAASDGYITAISLATKTKIWTIYTGSADISSPVLVDFGNDCNFEILAGTAGGALYCIPESGSGNCPGWTSQFYSAGGAIYSIAVTNVDSCLTIGDSDVEIIFGAGINLTILSKSGTLKSQRNLSSLVVSSPAIADINGDGCGEIFITTQNGNIHGFYLKNSGGSLYPEYITGFPKSTGSTISVEASPVICNIDGDTNLELITGNDSSTLRIYDIGAGGTVKWIPGATFCHLSATGCQRRWDSLSACGY